MYLKITAHSLIVAFFILFACSSNDEPKPFDCAESDLSLELSSKTNPSDCQANGAIVVLAGGGKASYSYSINGGSFGSSASFNSLTIGTYLIVVKDQNGCEVELEVMLTDVTNDLSATLDITEDTECLTSNGSITVNASGGSGSYQYAIGNGAFGNNATFNSLSPGSYSVSIKDNNNCSVTFSAVVGQGPTGITYSGEILTIFNANCTGSGCHPNNGNLFTYDANGTTDDAKGLASKIKARTQNNTMPPGGGLSSSQKALIACWVDGGSPN
jgi:hypothetical protein